MKKLFRTQDILLLGLSGAVDFLDEFKDPFGWMGNAYKQMYGWVPKRFEKTDYYQTVYHSLKTGYIEKVIKDGEPYLRLTSNGRKKIQRSFPFINFLSRKWDGRWRIVIFDIEEKLRKDRDLLRRKLIELGFGMMQESVWISPYDVIVDFREFIKSVGLEEKVFALEATNLLAGDPRDLVKRIWPLDEINAKYEEIYRILIKIHDRDKLSINDEGEIREARAKYLEILKSDPCLPKELLPDDWLGEKVRKVLKDFK
ncbi:hypothetical protein KKA69_01335 [Patescibacteria group bacterium]|nr:hypothetical protein [Patescibacteria group bacterium]